MNQRKRKRLWLLPVLVLLLQGCARWQPAEPVIWQTTLPQTGVQMTLAGSSTVTCDEVFYIPKMYLEPWQKRTMVHADGVPRITFVGADSVELHFCEMVDNLYILYDRKEPQEKLDYLYAEQGNTVQYQLDTVTHYQFVVTKGDVTEEILVTCTRQVD